MSRVQLLQAPKNHWGTVFADQLNKTSQNVLNRIEREEARAKNNAFRDKQFNNTVKNQDRSYELNVNKFAETVNQNKNNNSYRDMYFGWQKNKDKRDFIYKKGRDEVKDNQWENQFDFNVMNYQKPNEMTIYQQENLQLKKDAAEAKAQAQRNKTIETLSATDGWDALGVNGQQQMIDYYKKTGLIPKINNPWFRDAKPVIPLTEEQT